MDGRVVGMATQIATESGQQRGDRLRRPSAVVERTAQRIIATGRADLPYMGIVGGDVPEGVVLQDVVAGGGGPPAPRRRDQRGRRDAATTNAGLAAALVAHAPGDRVTVRVLRDGDEVDVPVVLGTRPPAGPSAPPRALRQGFSP